MTPTIWHRAMRVNEPLRNAAAARAIYYGAMLLAYCMT